MPRKLRIGIDARAAAEEPAGRGRYVRELVRALPPEHDYLLYARKGWDGAPDADWRLIDAPDVVWHWRAARRASRECDVFLSTNSYLTAWFTRVPTVGVVFDMVAWLPAMQPRRRAALIERTTIRRALKRCAAVLCISEATERDLLERFRTAAGKTRVVPLAASDALQVEPSREHLDDVRARHSLPDEFVLSTGTLEPRKNLPRLIAAHAALTDPPPLLLAGPPGWQLDEALAGIDTRGGAVRTLGYVPDEDLPALYRLCTVFAYLSLYEGFGLPLLEAMACGAACVTSNVSSLPEVGGEVVVYADPLDSGSIRDALGGLLESDERRAELGARARERAAGFSWERTARDTIAIVSDSARDQPGPNRPAMS